MQPRLLVVAGSLAGTVHCLIEGCLSIGRGDVNILRLHDTGVSRSHCRIEYKDQRFLLTDLESRNGTFVNGVPVSRKLLQHGDTIRIVNSEFLFLIHEGELPDVPPQITQQTVSLESTVRLESSPIVPTFGVEIGRMARDLGALFKISNVINTMRDAETLQKELLRLIAEVIPADHGAVLLSQRPGDQGDSICTWSRSGDLPPGLHYELIQRAIWERTAVSVDAMTSPNQPRNILCVPLIAVERTLGALYLTSTPPVPPFREDHIHFLDSVSRIAAVTLENILALDALRSENLRLKQELNPDVKLIGESRQMVHLAQLISRVASSDSTVLILGESGTGKEVVARKFHEESPRHDRPFVAINCAAIPETLLESELFGNEKGAFTGAMTQRKGRLEAAADGTLFLDEIAELAPAMQAKLLRVLQQRTFERVGGNTTLTLKARVLAATNKNLEAAIKSGEFRQDLYYRLNVVSVTVPPLRDHREDIPLLALYFAAKYAQRGHRPFKGISHEARTLLLSYDWPGNIRELENAIEHAIVLGVTDEILPEDLPSGILEQPVSSSQGSPYYDALNERKKELIRVSLQQARGNFPAAARLLGLHPKYLHRLARNLNLKTESRTAGLTDEELD